jgi:hypothetical protein
MLRLRLSVFKVWSWAAGRSEAAGFGGGAIGLKRCGRRAMINGAHLSARRGEGQKMLEAGGAFLRWRRKPGGAPAQHIGLLGRARKAAAQKGVGRCSGLGGLG